MSLADRLSNVERILDWWCEQLPWDQYTDDDGGFTFTEIADCCGVNPSTVGLIVSGKHYYQADEAEQQRRLARVSPSARCYTPSPVEIASECERIQLERKSVEQDAGWFPPAYTTLQLGLKW